MPENVNLTIKATNTTLTPDVRALVESKFGSLAKFVRPHRDQEIRFAAEVGRKNKGPSKADDLFFAELNIVAGGERHRAVASARDMREAIDQVKREMTVHLSREHDRDKGAVADGGRAIKEALRADLAPAGEIEALIEEEAARIVPLPPAPTRRLAVTPAKVAKPKAKPTAAKVKKPAAKPKTKAAKLKAKPVAKKKKAVKAAAKTKKHGKKNTRGAKNRPTVKVSPKRR